MAPHRKYSRILRTGENNITATAALQVLDTFKVSGGDSLSSENFKEYRNSWLDAVNGGGLLKVNQGFFNFICCIETTVQRYLNIDFLKQYKGEDLREPLKIAILNDDFTEASWENLTCNLVNKSLSSILKGQIVEKWIDIRARAFVNTYIQRLKRNYSDKRKAILSKKGEPSMRKTLE